ncbi:uncharacterized protein LOC113335705 [Papaver somniferum]|uniref:uncharacterized protein LOC113335705 n=1 Tax=Papaver somniferum TaxID=3469 RepID=UPI000E6FD3C9|nr:uncharacterized protein LOC113335705 [Papaver somniferum]
MTHFCSMPKSEIDWDNLYGNRYLREHMQMMTEIDEDQLKQNIAKLNEEKLADFKEVTYFVERKDGSKFFLNGSAGTGKTFVYNAIAVSCRLKGDIVLTVASSGITSLLLEGGRTAHSTFRIPIDITSTSVCSIAKQKEEAEFIKQATLIIWVGSEPVDKVDLPSAVNVCKNR